MTVSAGLLLYRRSGQSIEVFLVHPGGPFFVNKDDGFWGIPKGLVEDDELDVDAAVREFEEETALAVDASATTFIPLGEVRQKSGKRVFAWGFEGDIDPEAVVSNEFEMEWPPRSGRMRAFPEIDQGAWFDLETARAKMNAAQRAFVERLVDALRDENAG